MHLMADALMVLGSRVGIGIDPANRSAYWMRHAHHHADYPGIPIEIQAGIEVEGRKVCFPLCREGQLFEFLDQEMTITTINMTGMDSATGLKMKVTIRIPFRPRDAQFSTVPVVYMEGEIERLPGSFRWKQSTDEVVEGRMFLGIAGPFSVDAGHSTRTAAYSSRVSEPWGWGAAYAGTVSCEDRIVPLEGSWADGNRLEASFHLSKGMKGGRLALAWCAYDLPVMNVLGELCPFKYTEYFSGIEEVEAWAVSNWPEVVDNSRKVDQLFSDHSLGTTVTHLMAQTLHSWLINTWWVKRPGGQDWFTVWEGICQLASTLDVEYTAAPFYLAVWPELLEMELRQWPLFVKDGTLTLGDRGTGTVFMSHDIGRLTYCTKDDYPHEMEVEESTNYIIMAYAHWRRTGNDSVIREQAGLIGQLLDFVVAADTTGNGIPDKGCANTLDDGSPAIQYASEQIYLGVKAMAACLTGADILEYSGKADVQHYREFARKAVETLEREAWLGDHYAVSLSRTMDGLTDPWTGKPKSGELKGWDAYHIYTPNGLVLLDMTGYETGLSPERLKTDIVNAASKTMGRYGSSHTDYTETSSDGQVVEGLAGHSGTVGWISMNMLRDMAAAYRGVDLMVTAERYWDYQCTLNSREMMLFHETFSGGHLHFYPRGIAIFGYFDAAAGFRYDAVGGKRSTNALRANLSVPLLLFADWKAGTAPRA